MLIGMNNEDDENWENRRMPYNKNNANIYEETRNLTRLSDKFHRIKI